MFFKFTIFDFHLKMNHGLIGTLPTHCRPAKRLIFNLNQDDQTVCVDVLTNGRIEWVHGGTPNSWISLAGISFDPIKF